MVRVIKEHIISGLLLVGFDRIDPLLYKYILGKIVFFDGKKEFRFSDEPCCEFFDSVVVHDENGYRLKDGYTLDTNVSLVEGKNLPLRRVLNCDASLKDYLNRLDYREIIFRKINAYGVKDINDLSNHFCSKEKGIIADMFGIDDNISIFKEALGRPIPDIPLVRVKKND